MKTILGSVLLCLVTALALNADSSPLPPGKGKFLIALWEPGTPIPGAEGSVQTRRVDEPDLVKFGGEILFNSDNRRVAILPLETVTELRKHEAVMYVQRIWEGESPEEWAATPGRSRFNIQENDVSDQNLQWGPKAYSYDGSGNITAVGTDQYTYDTAGRLIRSEVHTRVDGADVARIESFQYDAFGNLVGKQLGAANPVAISVDRTSNRLQGVTYDVAGNATRASSGTFWGTRTYAFDALNAMTMVSQGSFTRRMLYDGSDERIGTIIDQSTSRWTIRDLNGRIIREFRGDSGGVWRWEQDHIYGEAGLVAGESQTFEYTGASGTFTFGGRRHYHLDHLGSVRMVSDDSRRSLSEHDYAPFGATLGKTYQEPSYPGRAVDGMRFAGHWRDFLGFLNVDNSEYIDSMHARYYDPNLGRFLSVDPGRDWDPQQPGSWNLYSYVRNDPMNRTDPDGRRGVISRGPVITVKSQHVTYSVGLNVNYDTHCNISLTASVSTGLSTTRTGMNVQGTMTYTGVDRVEQLEGTSFVVGGAVGPAGMDLGFDPKTRALQSSTANYDVFGLLTGSAGRTVEAQAAVQETFELVNQQKLIDGAVEQIRNVQQKVNDFSDAVKTLKDLWNRAQAER